MLDGWRKTGLPVRAVYGNHDFYHSSLAGRRAEDRARLAELRAAGADIDLLDRKTEVIAGTRVTGCTLWTDLELYPSQTPLVREMVGRVMNDFKLIRDFRIADWLAEHAADRAFLFEELARPFDGPTVVMTHHIPVRELIHPTRHIGDRREVAVNGGFGSDLARLIRPHRVDAWICGHSHDNCSFTLEGRHGPIPFVTNARGYPKERAAFDPMKILRIGPTPVPGPSAG